MSYLVIARKWRPSLFEEIVGQAHVTRTLRNAVASGRIAHAYIFSGPRGVGKTTAARILAKSLNCAQGPTPIPCNKCESCKGIAGGSSVDVFEIDGASNNGVENVRELTDSVRYVPATGKYKIYIIDEVHMLSTAAFNALLKTLEEPPPHAIFIFATTEVHKIPATILSRCQRFDFKRIPFRELQQHLQKIVAEEGIKFEEKAVFTLAREADGSLRDGQSLLEQVLAFSVGGELKDSDVVEALGLMDRSILYELSEAIISRDGKACLNIVEKIYNFGYDLKRGCSDLLEHIRDLTVVKVTGEGALLDLPDSELEHLKRLADNIGVERLHMTFSIISKGYEEVSRSATPRYSLEMALLKAAHLDEIQPVSELISRLEELRPRMEGAVEAPRQAYSAPQRPAPQAAQPPRAAKPVEEKKVAFSAPSGEAKGFMDFLKNRNSELAELLQSASINVDGDILEIEAPGMAGTKISVNKGAIEALGKEFFKRPIKVNGAGSAGSAEKKREIDPVVKDAAKILGGRIISGS
ncbi:MAG: DNA polymerase III subunit gamma/tau [Deltaproteobacteria bacterium]|nr:DNA polymerase III subunit gamma/tau [Deltaproteobacteria bacterium]